MLHNIQIICPIVAKYVINSHSQKPRFFISGDQEITSAEGTTQDNPTVMSIYDLGPLQILNIATTDCTKRAAYGDDVNPRKTVCLVGCFSHKQNTKIIYKML